MTPVEGLGAALVAAVLAGIAAAVVDTAVTVCAWVGRRRAARAHAIARHPSSLPPLDEAHDIESTPTDEPAVTEPKCRPYVYGGTAYSLDEYRAVKAAEAIVRAAYEATS